MPAFSPPALCFALLWIIGLGSGSGSSIAHAFKVPFRAKDVLPVLPRGISWSVLNNFHSAVDLLPYFVGSVTPNNASIEWKGACFYENKAKLEFTAGDRDDAALGGGILYLQVCIFFFMFPLYSPKRMARQRT